ncbi:MAG: DUF5777 family beta-barrel protein [bacterium]
MKKLLIIVVFLLASVSLFAVQYEVPMLDMTVPSGLTANQMYVNFGHKLLQPLNKYPTDNFFAIVKNGASFNLNLRYMIWNGLEIKTGYNTIADEKNVGLSWVAKAPSQGLSLQADVLYYNYDDRLIRNQMASNFLYLLSAQSVPLIWDRFSVAVNAGYDGYFSEFVMGLGVSAMIVDNVTLVGEYYPLANDIMEKGKIACYGFGLRYSTYGHQFMLKFGNSTQMEPRELMLGTTTNDMYVGISMMRFVDFNAEE